MTQTSKYQSSRAAAQSCCSSLSDLLSADFFKALSDPNRLSILTQLTHGASEKTVSELASCCPIDLSVVSRHLRVLRDAGVLSAEKRGKEVFYRTRVRELVGVLRGLADALEDCCLTNKPGCCLDESSSGEQGE